MDINKITHHVKSTITKRYVFALSIIAILSTLAYYMLNLALADSQSVAYIVNISGKQRMLSQHIALDVYKIHQRHKDARPNEILKIQKRLQELSQEMLSANTMLSTGKLDQKTQIKLSHEIHVMYFGDMNIAKRVAMYANNAKEFASAKQPENAQQLIDFFDAESEGLLRDLNVIVAQYQKEGETNLSKIQHLESIIYIVTIMTLLVEIIFIFQPLVRNLMEISKENEVYLNDLEHQVQLRTLHLEHSNERLSKLAGHDPMTGLLNRLSLETDMNKLIHYYDQNNSPFAALIFDIDWFKDVNDTYGHDAGDFVLCEFANLLKEHFRQEDRIYRAGGEEFVALLGRINVEEALLVAQKIRQTVQDHIFKKENFAIQKTISIGVYHSSIDSDAKTYKNIYKLADIALYKAKENGRNRVVLAQKEESTEEEKIHEEHKCLFIFEEKNFQKILEANGPIFEITGYRTKEFIQHEKDFLSMIYAPDLEILLSTEPFTAQTIRIVSATGNIKIVRLHVHQHSTSTIIEMYDVKIFASGIRDAMLVYNLNAMLENTNDFIYFKDANHLFTGASKSLVNITSAQNQNELLGKNDYEVFETAYADEYFKLERAVFSGKIAVAQAQQPFITNGGEKGWVDNRKYPIKDAEGNIIGLFGIARVIT